MKIICHHKGHYNFYSTISDGFAYVSSITLDQLTQIVKDNYGEAGIAELPERLERAHEVGHSYRSNDTLEEFLCCNRAGQNESFLTIQQCIDEFLS